MLCRASLLFSTSLHGFQIEKNREFIVEELGDLTMTYDDLIADKCGMRYDFEFLKSENVPKIRIFFVVWYIKSS